MSIYDDASLVMIPSGYKDDKLYSIKPVEKLGSELVTNGSFSSASDWTFSGSGVAISNGTLNFNSTTREASQSISVVNTKTYRVSYEVLNYSSGSVRVEIGSSVGITRNANGIYSEYIVASGTNTIEIDAVSFFTGSIDNVSVKEVITSAGDFTFSRDGSGASPATRVNASGLIEKGRENLLLQSNTFDTTWTNFNSSETSGQSGYDGSSDAWLISKSGANGNINQVVSISGVYSFSVYAKAGTDNWIQIRMGSVTLHEAFFDLANGLVGTESNLIDSSIEAVGATGWYRCSITANVSSVSYVRFYVADADNDTSGTSGNIYIQDAQLESGLVATDYIETTTTAVSAGLLGDMPRLDYSGGATCPSLLLEPARTNLLTQSEYLAAYGVTGIGTITTNSDISPEGVQNAFTMTDNDSGNYYRLTSDGISFNGNPHHDELFCKENNGDTF